MRKPSILSSQESLWNIDRSCWNTMGHWILDFSLLLKLLSQQYRLEWENYAVSNGLSLLDPTV